jgi:hypothetical protein
MVLSNRLYADSSRSWKGHVFQSADELWKCECRAQEVAGIKAASTQSTLRGFGNFIVQRNVEAGQ